MTISNNASKVLATIAACALIATAPAAPAAAEGQAISVDTKEIKLAPPADAKDAPAPQPEAAKKEAPAPIDLEKMNFSVGEPKGAAVKTEEINLEEVIARVGSEEIKMKDLMKKLEELPPQIPRDRVNREMKSKIVENLVNEKMIDAEMKKAGFDSNPKIAEMQKGVEKRLTFHFFIKDESANVKGEPKEEEIKDFYEKNKAMLGGATLEQVKGNIAENLKQKLFEEHFEKMYLELAKQHEAKTEETTLAKVADLMKLEGKDLELPLFKMKDWQITLGDVKSTIKLDEAMRSGQPALDLSDAEVRAEIVASMLKNSLLIKAAEAKGIVAEKDGRIKADLEKVMNNLKKRLFIEEEVFRGLAATDDEKKKFFEEHKKEYMQDDQVRASHILVADEAKAKDLKKKIDEAGGKNFEELAKAESTCPSKEKGGDLGNFGRGQMVPEFEQKAFGGEIGKVSEPFKTQFGWHIIKVTEKKEGKQLEYKDVAQAVDGRIMNDKKKKAFEQFKEKAKVEILFDKLK